MSASPELLISRHQSKSTMTLLLYHRRFDDICLFEKSNTLSRSYNNDITAFDSSNCLAVIMYDVCLEGNCVSTAIRPGCHPRSDQYYVYVRELGTCGEFAQTI